MNFTTVENAIRAQVKLAAKGAEASIADNQVIWSHQNGPRTTIPTTPPVLIVLQHMGSTDVGSTVYRDVILNPSPSAGQEILERVFNHVDFDIRVWCYSTAATGNFAAANRLSYMRTFLERESVLYAWDTADLASIESSPIQVIPEVLETKFESRAFFDLSFRACDLDEEANTYIETVTTAGTYTT